MPGPLKLSMWFRYLQVHYSYTINLGILTFFFSQDDTKAKNDVKQKKAGSAASRTRDPPVCTN